jgi:hypothetical protein
MSIDLRANVTCSLGTLITGSVSDDYIQGSGLIKTSGSVELSGIVTPAIGTVVTFLYTKDGNTYSIPRKLRVLSSFADPYRRITKVELGCKLTYLSDLKESIDWTAFDDPLNTGFTTADARIITIPIYASSAMNKCLTELGITANNNPLTNAFSIASFDFSSGYVEVLSNLLVSESYCGYLDGNEILQIFSLNQNGGTGPVINSSNIIDLGSIGTGDLPGEAVTVSYSTLKLTQPDNQSNTAQTDNQANTAQTLWEEEITYGLPQAVFVDNPFYDRNPFPYPIPQYYQYNYTPTTITTTEYDDLNRVKKRYTVDYTIAAVIAPSYVQHRAGAYGGATSPPTGSKVFTITTTELFDYVYPYSLTKAQNGGVEPDPAIYEQIAVQVTRVTEPMLKLMGSTQIYEWAGQENVDFSYRSEDFSRVTTSLVYVYPETTNTEGYDVITKNRSESYSCFMYTQQGQQGISSALYTNKGSTVFFTDLALSILEHGASLIYIGTESKTAKGRAFGLQSRPSPVNLINGNNASGGDPNNGYRTDSTSELELALGSATAQRRIEFSLPYAPDDKFIKHLTNPVTYGSIPSDAPQKAATYGRIQNKLLLGNRNGMNLQLTPELMPSAPFSPVIVQANGLSALYRINGTNWQLSSDGVIASTDALFWGAIGSSGGTTGAFWFPVAPGITTLPSTPPEVNGQITVDGTIPVWNETVILNGILKVSAELNNVSYSLDLVTQLDSTVLIAVEIIKTKGFPVTNIIDIQVNALAPRFEISFDMRTPATDSVIDAIVPIIGREVGIYVSPTTADCSITAYAPTAQEAVGLRVPAADITIISNLITIPTGNIFRPSAADTAINSIVPTVGRFVGIYANPVATNTTIDGLPPLFSLGSTNSLLLHMDGTNGSTTFTDSSQNLLSVTANGNAVISSTQSKFGGASGFFDGTGDYLSIANTTATDLSADFTVEAWINVSSFATANVIAGKWGSTQRCWLFSILSATSISFSTGSNGTFSLTTTKTTPVTLQVNTWYHVAACRSGTSLRLFVDGVQASTTATDSANCTGTQVTAIGINGDGNISGFFGYIDELRICKLARYVANFTPPTSAFPNA